MNKLYYSISEVSKLLDEEQHILRYWEKEFPQIKPRKNKAGNRIYTDKDILVLKNIKQLLRDDKLSLKGAKEKLAKSKLAQKEKSQTEDLFFEMAFEGTEKKPQSKISTFETQDLVQIRDLLVDIRNFLR